MYLTITGEELILPIVMGTIVMIVEKLYYKRKVNKNE